jgi:acyl-CoA thioester hydrolase
MHVTRLRVRFDEVDSMQVVHHPRYLVYFEIARTEFFRTLGSAYRELMESGTHLAVVETGVRHLRPSRYDDELTVETRCTELSGARVTFRYVVRGADGVRATGFTRLGAIEPSGRAKRLPAELAARFRGVVEPDAEDASPPRVQRGA